MKYVKAFLIGSSFPVTLWPFLYLGISFTLNPVVLKMGLVPLMIPIIMGLANMLHAFLESKYTWGNKGLWIFGGTYGLLLSVYGNYSGLPTKLFLLSEFWQYFTIPFAVIAYSLIWRYVIGTLNRKIKF